MKKRGGCRNLKWISRWNFELISHTLSMSKEGGFSHRGRGRKTTTKRKGHRALDANTANLLPLVGEKSREKDPTYSLHTRDACRERGLLRRGWPRRWGGQRSAAPSKERRRRLVPFPSVAGALHKIPHGDQPPGKALPKKSAVVTFRHPLPHLPHGLVSFPPHSTLQLLFHAPLILKAASSSLYLTMSPPQPFALATSSPAPSEGLQDAHVVLGEKRNLR